MVYAFYPFTLKLPMLLNMKRVSYKEQSFVIIFTYSDNLCPLLYLDNWHLNNIVLHIISCNTILIQL
jgi:hypothetical protein